MPSVASYPVQALREHATALEAALSVCLAEPDKKAVHKLRTETRRIEALIALLKGLRGLPPFRAAAGKLLKNSRKLRRAAGNVRDLDVQHKLIKDELEKVMQDAEDRAALQQRFDDFLLRREEVRTEMAKKLLVILGKRQAKVAGSLEALLHALKPAETRTLSAAEMLAVVHGAFRATRELRLKSPDDDELHTIRKAAKRARYQLETAPNAATAVRAARLYEALQDAGGQWHDWLALRELAAAEIGEHHRITVAFAAGRDKYLKAYFILLQDTREAIEAEKLAARARKTKRAASKLVVQKAVKKSAKKSVRQAA